MLHKACSTSSGNLHRHAYGRTGWLLCFAVFLLAVLFRPALTAQASDAASSHTSITAALLSDPHLDPFRDPAKARRLAVAPVSQWQRLLSEPPSDDADARFTHLQETCKEKLPDSEVQLELSAFDDAQAAHPSFVLVAGDMLVHGFGCRYRALLDPNGTDAAGLADFATKTIEFQLQQLQQRFPAIPIHLALGNNDTDCEDYALDENSQFLHRIATALSAGWSGTSPRDRKAAVQTLRRFGSYSLPLAEAVPNTRILVLDDLYLSSDYKGPCGNKPRQKSGTALLAWVGSQLAQARQAHQAVWILAHIPPQVNIYRTYLHPHDICHGEAPATFFLNDDFNNLLARYADTVRVFISGHTHVDEIHLLEGDGNPSAVALKTIPSISPVSTNAPAYLLAQVDSKSATMTGYIKRTASSPTGPNVHWTTAYDFRDRYHEPAFTAATVEELLHRWQTQPQDSASQMDGYATSIASGLRLLAFRASWPQQLCAMQHSSASAFTTCACSASGGLLPPLQSAK